MTEAPQPGTEPAERWSGLVTPWAVTVVLVAWSLRRYITHINADTLLYALISTEDLTFFYWGQDRLANVVPALAWPVRDLGANLIVQLAILAASFHLLLMALAWFVLRARGVTARGVPLAAATAVGSLTFGVALRRVDAQVFLLEQQYALSTLVGVVGLWWIVQGDRRRQLIGAALVVIATLVIPSFVLLAPFAVLMLDDMRDWRRLLPTGLVAAGAFVVTMVAARLFSSPSQRGDYDDFSLARLRRGLAPAASSITGSLDLSIAVPIGLAVLAVLVARWRQIPSRLKITLAVAVAYALAWLVVFSANAWVEDYSFKFRYFFPVYLAGITVVFVAVIELLALAEGRLRASWRGDRKLTVAVAALLAGAGAWGVSLERVEDLEPVQSLAGAVARHDVDFVAGDYWQVWPTTFQARLEGADVIGVAHRSDPLADEAQKRIADDRGGAQRVLCVPADIPACVGSMVGFTDRNWVVGVTLSTDPLVVEMTPAPG